MNHDSNQSSVNEALLFKYFSATTTVFEKKQIEEWARDPVNRERFFRLLAQWEQQNPQFLPDVDRALERHFERMAQQAGRVQERAVNRTWPLRRQIWLIAASVLLVLGIMGGLFRESLMYQTVQTAFGQTRTLQLPDGSRVTLNANSSLRLPRFGFGNRVREVLLDGEAEFSIRHLPDHQKFIVKTARQLDVVVLGTEFVVYSRERGARVVLKEGKVQLRYQEGKVPRQVIMKPGDLVTIDGQKHLRRVKTADPESHVAWKAHRFVFDQTPLSEITHLLAENFGLKVSIASDSLARWTVSGSFTAQSGDDLLENLVDAANLRYRREGNKVFIFEE